MLRFYYNAEPILSGQVIFQKEGDPDSESIKELRRAISLPKVSDAFLFSRWLHPWYSSGTGHKMKLFRSSSFTI